MTPGRPSDYKQEYCQMLIDHMEKGFSFESFAGMVLTTRASLYRWRDKYEDFRDASNIGRELCRVFWEKAGIDGMWKGKEFNSGVWAKNISNRFRDEWTDQSKSEVNTTSEIKIVIDADDAEA